MNGKRLPALLGLALLPALALGQAQTAQAATHDSGRTTLGNAITENGYPGQERERAREERRREREMRRERAREEMRRERARQEIQRQERQRQERQRQERQYSQYGRPMTETRDIESSSHNGWSDRERERIQQSRWGG
jgi:TolA-binding protein